MEYVVIKTGGKQYKVAKDSIIEVERLASKKGENITFDQVLLHVADDNKVKLGKPTLNGYKVKANVLEETKGEKIRVARFKAKSKYRRVTGHRQSLSKVKILDILTAVKN